ncbi:hypothetical protein D0C16_15735 [Cellvibrio sp. KY-GH-1]|uniref:hypothetical protein n=1 Tax=Cellvibrio sp. KY-GH-1 TaxID=2303332 RepID=UPI0012476C37|nr:hypothetical protein [Cellvibrio sp. KY-GH-1]QEY17304.1 hypothetical protein D0C16_15735 [Cellvibrio sp. KY-GH-1]
MKQFLRVKPGALLLSVMSGMASAQQFGGHISASSGESDNAYKSETRLLTERQDTYEVALAGDYTNQFLSGTAEYTGLDRRFAEHSQEDVRTLDGAASLMLGAPTDPVDLQLKHSRHTLLSAPDEINVTTNQDEREIVSVIPRVKKRISAADMVLASADFTQIDFTKNELNNSKRTTAALSWIRRASKVSNINLQAQQSDIKFDNFDSADYRYTNAVVVYSTQLRNLSYSLAVGYNRSERDSGDNYGSPTYAFSTSYKTPLHSFKLMSSKAITDSSMGNGNVRGVNQNPDNDGAFKVDQIERVNTEVSWGTQALCIKCTLSLSLHQNKDDYLLLPDEGRQEGGSASFTYSFTEDIKASYKASDLRQRFVGSLIGRDYDYKTQRLELAIGIVESFSFRVFMELEDRDSDDNDRTYNEEFVGAALSYAF